MSSFFTLLTGRLDRARRRARVIALLLIACASAAQAQFEVLRSRTSTPNGRAVQEIRLGEDPSGPTALRITVITNGPTSGTTSLLTAVGDLENWLDPALPLPVFTPVIASGAIFSLGSGCRRGGQLDFPFIHDNRPKILRFTGGTPIVVSVPVTDTHAYDSADCTVSDDGARTFFIFSDRNENRLKFFDDGGAANDLVIPLVSFSSHRTPFAGGLRPSISVMPDTTRSAALLYMQTDGTSRWLQFNTSTINVDFNCLAGTQSPPPSGFTIPRGARVAGHNAVADFNNDGVFDFVTISKASPACSAAPASTPAGAVSGTGFNWTEPAAARSAYGDFYTFMYGRALTRRPPAAVVNEPGPHSGAAGSFSVCAIRNSETPDAFLSITAETVASLRLAQSRYVAPSAPTEQRLFGSGMEPRTRAERMACIVRAFFP